MDQHPNGTHFQNTPILRAASKAFISTDNRLVGGEQAFLTSTTRPNPKGLEAVCWTGRNVYSCSVITGVRSDLPGQITAH